MKRKTHRQRSTQRPVLKKPTRKPTKDLAKEVDISYQDGEAFGKLQAEWQVQHLINTMCKERRLSIWPRWHNGTLRELSRRLR